MNPKKAIRIIKRDRRDIQGAVVEKSAPNNTGLRQTTREAAGQVATWVKEFQQRRKIDPKRAFASLFVESASSVS
jgi:hypothetical protein